MLAFRDFITAFRKLDLDGSRPVIVHTSLSAFGEVHGGAQTILGALISSFGTFIMPTFTYKAMIIPEVGPPDNAIAYGSGKDTNRMAEIFRPDMPADHLMGVVSEALRTHAGAQRTLHPILSFAGINAAQILDSQTIKHPLLPIKKLMDAQGWVLLLGVDHTVNTSIHYYEQLAGRKQFTRWALTPKGIVRCTGYPGCSQGFEAVASRLAGVVRPVELGKALIQAIPLVQLAETVSGLIQDDPAALLCAQEDCARCNAVRDSLATNSPSN